MTFFGNAPGAPSFLYKTSLLHVWLSPRAFHSLPAFLTVRPASTAKMSPYTIVGIITMAAAAPGSG